MVQRRTQFYDAGLSAIAIRVTSGANASPLFSMDSDLEAFSHNPTDGSFGALSVQTTP